MPYAGKEDQSQVGAEEQAVMSLMEPYRKTGQNVATEHTTQEQEGNISQPTCSHSTAASLYLTLLLYAEGWCHDYILQG